MRTMCYQPGPFEKPDLSEFSMVDDADQLESELPSTTPDQPLSTSTIDKIDNGVKDIRLETSEMKGNGLLGKVAA
ncbi:hypothetical protein V865_001800 [Kwoniella europaea PYCC6329]|uniref:Uncharacterized protein n=1 Tax=Kwoniella europaea PYCC6329 TaxID=1423913 RepID=A0AAX4KC43_9TREE